MSEEDGVSGEGEERFDYDRVMAEAPTRRLRALPSLLAASFRIVRRAAPRQVAVTILLQLTNAIVVAGQVLVVRVLLGRMLGDVEVEFSDLRAPLAALVVMYGVVGFTGLLLAEQQRLLSELTARYTNDLLLDAATSVELIDLDRPAFHDRLLRAQLNAATRPVQMVNAAVGIVSSLFTIGGVAIALLIVQPVFLVLLLVGFAPAWFATRRISRSTYRFTAAQARRDRLRGYLSAVLIGRDHAKEVRAYDLASPLRRRHDGLYDARIADIRTLVRERTRVGLFGSTATAVLAGLTVTGLAWYATSGRTSLADAGAATAAMLLLVQRLQALQAHVGGVYESSLFVEDFTGFVQDLARVERSRPDLAAPNDPHDIRAESVTFRYPSSPGDVLDDVSLRLERDQVVALVGENGSGKTTLAKILAGLLEPSGGRVTWDGIDIATCDLRTARDRVAILFQDFARFQLTLGDNVELGRWTSAGDAERRDAAADKAGLADILGGLPNGFDSPLGPEFLGGVDLSIGQWQRVALARAIFREAPIVILDEPTASLDPRAESELFERMRDLYAGSAVLLISHRFASVRSADRIYVLDHGRIVEEGRHDELMASRGLYAELFTRQAAGYIS